MIFPITGFRVLSVMIIVSSREACSNNVLLCVALLFIAYFFMLTAEALAKLDK